MAVSVPRIGALVVALALVGCATAPQPLYQWGKFPSYTYDALRGVGTTPVEQLAAMKAHAAVVTQQGKQLPPGFRAHMGLLEIKLGNERAAQEHFAAEQAAFPESGAYIEALRKAASKPQG